MQKYITLVLVRLVLPAGLLLSIALRPFGLSLIYLLLFLLAPLAQVPDNRTFSGWRGKFLLLTMFVSWLLLLTHAVWHSVLAGFAPYGSLLDDYPIIQDIGLNLGLVTYSGIDPFMAVHYLAPELVMTGLSLSVYLIVKKVCTITPTQGQKKDAKYQQYPMLVNAGKYICLFLIMFSGIMRPSVTSGIYFLIFMGAATAWAVGRPLEKGFAVIGRCLMAIMAVHIAGLLVYQCSWLIELYPPDMDMARYFGLTKLVELNSTSPTSFTYEVTDDHMWATLASPLVILFTYYVLGIESRELFKPKPKKKSALTGIEAGKLNGSLVRGVSFHRRSQHAVKDKWMSATKKVRVAYSYINSKALRGNTGETVPLMRSVSPSKRWSSVRSGSKHLHQDSTGSVVVPDEDDTLMEEEEEQPSLVDDVITAVFEFFQVLIRSSYIATTITMMAWSIMFHSWLTFVLLMWANIVWLCHDQRSFMLKTSPVLVCYAMLLLLAQYIYGMDLYEAELPSNITEVNLAQIGLSRPEGEPCVPLLIKSLFTCMFWVTLRQRVQEIRERRRSAVIIDMAAPLQLTVSTAASVIEAQREEESRSRLLRQLGDWLKAACARYWIYVVVIMLFVIGVTGDRMTIFKIIYMFLFLTFILMFQISWYWWRRLMYVFWITVIIYSMINLILIYIYQFDNFSVTIENYLLINQKLQHDLGLEPYHPADLFVKLLTPTCFLIITIMQVHYFHKDFMALSDPRTRTNSLARDPDSSRPSQVGASTMRDDLPQLPMEGEVPPVSPSERTPSRLRGVQRETSYTELPSSKHRRSRSYAPTVTEPRRRYHGMYEYMRRSFLRLKAVIYEWTDKIFIYLDIHLVKVIFISLMLLCCMNVCAMHVPIMIMIAPCLWLSSRKQRFCVLFISTLLSVYFMAKMVYQIDYIQHSIFDVNCTTTGANDTLNTTVYNNAEWLGFTKATKQRPLVVILKGYIALIALITFYSLVTYRQQTLRSVGLLPKEKDKRMFPEITRKEADANLINCIKFLINYGFYKFGIEISLICLMGVIGSRMDLYAVLYAGWLLALVSMRRPSQARIWTVFTAFVTFIIPLQYMISVGFLPQFCVQYPWDIRTEQWSNIRTWMYLPYADDPPHAMKLIFDYFLLLFATRQMRVFYVEKTQGDSYPGGSNSEDIGKDWETPHFVNPVPDFLGYVGSWLDVVKRLVFLGMLWVTLAIMFMTGTNRVNLFSMGYLIGSFIFLWQGTDFYLRPKEAILQWWSWLVRYNVCVVAVKALLQVPGCMFSSVLQEHACWLVQLLGIGCVDKFAGNNIRTFLRMVPVKVGEGCSVPQEDIGLAWDGVCFAFLILERRLFHSYYFYRVIDESKATTVLASRGAELIEELRQKQMVMQEETEMKILDKIKIKMERIKANQKKIQGVLMKEGKHHDAEEDEDTQPGESEGAPLVRGDSDASGRGYHTPDSPASPRGFHTPISEPSAPPSPERAHPPPPQPLPLPALPPPSSQGGPPSPSSALMTVSLEAYLEPRRISFESPPNSEFMPRAQTPEESYPVFSPPPIRRRHTVASPSIQQRTSIISQSSRAEPLSHHTSVRSGDYYMFDEFDDTDSQDVMKQEESDYDEDEPKEMGFGKLLSTALKTDLKRAVSMRRASAPAIRRPHLSLGSYPASYPHERRRSLEEDESRTGGAHLPLSERDRDDPASELDDYEAPPGKETAFEKVKNLLETVWAFISSFLVSLTRHLMKYSRDYRYVSRTLSIEKKLLKEKEGFGIGLREGSQMIWEPLPETLHHHRKLSDISVPEIRILAPSMERGLDASPPARSPRASPRSRLAERDSCDSYRRDDDDTSEHESAFSLQTTSSKDVSTLEEQDDSMFKQEKSPFVHLGYALWFAVIAHTDIVCYIMVFINQIQSATILSIPLPLMVFLWGTLTIPRPTKTFWVTLIAYTEVIVLIKSMFQFEILPWNQKATPANMPFTAPRIIGIERTPNYALYDLLLLLIIFFHRFMLKSLGLWKESTPEIELREDVEYPLTMADTEMIVEGRGDEVGQKYVLLHDQIGPRHRLVDRLYHVQATIADAMHELGTSRSDPRVATLVWQRLQKPRALRRQPAVSLKEIVSQEMHRRRTEVNATTLGLVLDNNQVEVRSSEGLADDGEEDNEAGPSKPPDGEGHFVVNDDQEPIIAVMTVLEDKYKHFPEVMVLSVKRYLRPAQRFFRRMLAPGARVTADVYAYMFLCDFFNFLVVIFGFAAFGTHQGDGGVQAYLEENKVPIPFLVMLILQFALIVIDRALYLRKFILGKILFQYGLIVGVHIWMFFVLPFITERTFNARAPPPIWYMMKCIYLLLSAYQIRCGYPRRIIGNFLCKSYHFLNMIFFRGFMAVPFVFELRTLMDWIWTDTSMTLMDWLKMEDIFASVYLLKCSRYVEDEFPQPRGAKKSPTSKYLLGGGVLAFVIAIIWFPLVFFAFGNTVGEFNPPTDVTVKIRIGPFLPVYQMSAQRHNIDIYTEQDYTQLSSIYMRDRTAQTFLSNYIYNDVAVVTINPNSTMKWEISPPELRRLEKEVASNESLAVKFTYIITHPTNAVPNPPTLDDSREVSLPPFLPDGKRNPERDKLLALLDGTAPPDTWLHVNTLFPKFLKVFNKGSTKAANQLMPPKPEGAHDDARYFRDVQLRLERENGAMFWRVREFCTKPDPLSSIPLNNCDMLIMYTFNDKLFPETLNFISGSGIIGLYTTFVFLASRVLRGFFSGIYTKIMFDDLPNVDRVLQLCLDIYLVREALELSLEEDLFAKLVFLYRSPETMIKWSRPKEEEQEPQRALPPSR